MRASPRPTNTLGHWEITMPSMQEAYLAADRDRAEDKLKELRLIGRHMRAAQQKFFKTKAREDLINAKQLEKQFDRLIEPQP